MIYNTECNDNEYGMIKKMVVGGLGWVFVYPKKRKQSNRTLFI